MRVSSKQMLGFLDRLQDRFHKTEYLGSDPLEFVHRYENPHDQEAVALVAALLAYGNVRQIRKSVDALILRMGDSPARFLQRPLAEKRAALRGFVHRFNTGDDLAELLECLAESWKVHGSLGMHFLSGLGDRDLDFSAALNRLIREWRSRAESRGVGKKSSFHYLLTAPEAGSCCKRWCMFLRWMGRRDSLDPGLWTQGSPLVAGARVFLRAEQLVIPLDTHTSRITRYLGFTERMTTSWKTALDVTKALKAIDPVDPVRFDFAIARLGILKHCRRKYDAKVCSRCDLVRVCRFAKAAA